MKFLIFLLLATNANASFIAKSDVELFIADEQYTSFANKGLCEEIKASECISILGLPSAKTTEEVDNIVLDYVAKLQEESCLDIADCDIKFAALVCAEGVAINNYDLLQVYCAKDIMKVDGKKLQESAAKKAAQEAKQVARQAKRDQRESRAIAALEAMKNLSKSEFDALTAAQKNNLLWHVMQTVLQLKGAE